MGSGSQGACVSTTGASALGRAKPTADVYRRFLVIVGGGTDKKKSCQGRLQPPSTAGTDEALRNGESVGRLSAQGRAIGLV